MMPICNMTPSVRSAGSCTVSIPHETPRTQMCIDMQHRNKICALQCKLLSRGSLSYHETGSQDLVLGGTLTAESAKREVKHSQLLENTGHSSWQWEPSPLGPSTPAASTWGVLVMNVLCDDKDKCTHQNQIGHKVSRCQKQSWKREKELALTAANSCHDYVIHPRVSFLWEPRGTSCVRLHLSLIFV